MIQFFERFMREPETQRDAENCLKGFIGGVMVSFLLGMLLFYFGSLILLRAIAEVSQEVCQPQKVEVRE